MQPVHVSFQASILPAQQHSNVLMVLPNTAKKGVPEMSHDPKKYVLHHFAVDLISSMGMAL